MSSDQKIKSVFYNDTRKICREVGIYVGAEFSTDALDLICELAWKKLVLYGSDLEAFAKHGKRTTVLVDDVRLLVRRNESLKELVEEKYASMAGNKANDQTGSGGVKRKRKPPATVN